MILLLGFYNCITILRLIKRIFNSDFNIENNDYYTMLYEYHMNTVC